MQMFSVIYDAAVFMPDDGPFSQTSTKISELDPIKQCKLSKKKWKRTEKGAENYGGGIEARSYGKWVACLTKEEFKEFVETLSMVAEKTETMGMLGAPLPRGGMTLGCLPAVSFRADGVSDADVGAYVCPLIGKMKDGEFVPIKAECTDRDWERVRDACVRQFATGRSDCPPELLPVLLENGNTWWYPLEACSRARNLKLLPAYVRREKAKYCRVRNRAKAAREAALRGSSQSGSPSPTPQPRSQAGTGQPSTQPPPQSLDGE